MRRSLLFLLAVVALSMIGTTAFGQVSPEQPDAVIDGATRKSVVEALSREMTEQYVFPDVARKMADSLNRQLQSGAYDKVTSANEFARVLTEDVRAVSHDKHLRVRYSKESIPVSKDEEPSADQREKFRRFGMRANFGFEKLERMPGNIGYIDLRGFFSADQAADTLTAAMNFLSNTDALIIDLRKNGGGDPEMVALFCSYLFGSQPVHLNDLYWRKGDRVAQFWTKKEVPGKRYEGKDVYVLTSNYTFSGAEEFSYNLKNLKRATIVGETTGGGANPGGTVRLTDHFGAFIPTGRAINPITKTNWEGTGVSPDVAVAKEAALKTAYLMALNNRFEKLDDEDLKASFKKLIEETRTDLEQVKKGVAGTK